jgi:hypothetical protein
MLVHPNLDDRAGRPEPDSRVFCFGEQVLEGLDSSHCQGWNAADGRLKRRPPSGLVIRFECFVIGQPTSERAVVYAAPFRGSGDGPLGQKRQNRLFANRKFLDTRIFGSLSIPTHTSARSSKRRPPGR